MSELPDSVIHWILGAMVPAGGGLFLWMLKRTFSDFESKISELFSGLKDSFKAQQDHDTRIQLLEQRLSQVEDQRRGSRRRR